MKNEIIALSASHGNNLNAILLLGTADLIYSTQVRNRNALYDMFGKDKVKFIPDNRPDMINFLKERHKGATFITYSDLYNLRLSDEE